MAYELLPLPPQTDLETKEILRKTASAHCIRAEFPKMFSQDLLNNIFRHPYTKIEFVMNDLGVSRPTASIYLDKLCKGGFLEKQKRGVSNYYINTPLLKIFLPKP